MSFQAVVIVLLLVFVIVSISNSIRLAILIDEVSGLRALMSYRMGMVDED